MNDILELYGHATFRHEDWQTIVRQQQCPYLNKKCIKVRKSEPEISIGTCSVAHGRFPTKHVLICPYRLLERNQVFMDCIHLLTLHEPGNELHVVREISIPGGNVDYVLLSVRGRNVKDFVGIELQTLDTTGSVWPSREEFLLRSSLIETERASISQRRYGMNWKMTAKTILLQLHHKIQTFDTLSKHLVVVVQDHLLDYLKDNFAFEHVRQVSRIGDSLQFHSYTLESDPDCYRLNLVSRLSTDAEGLAKCLGMKAEPNITLYALLELLQKKISNQTLLSINSSQMR